MRGLSTSICGDFRLKFSEFKVKYHEGGLEGVKAEYGNRPIVADPGGLAFVLTTGNPGLATPGTGDVLSGIIAGQLAKGLSATDAAVLGGYVHGLAADLAVELAVSKEGMIAGDLFDFLPLAVERLITGDEDDDDHDHHHEEED